MPKDNSERAVSMALASAMFRAGSVPPSRAATVITRDSLLNSLPRLASSLPFLCLMVAHLECPDTRTPPPFSAVVGRRGCGAAQLAGGARLRRADRLGRRALPGADHADEQLVQTGVIGQLGVKGGHQDAAREGGVLVTAFHPELTDDTRLHELFIRMIRAREGAAAEPVRAAQPRAAGELSRAAAAAADNR